MSIDYDRTDEIKAFDVKGLVDACNAKIPPFFVHPHDHLDGINPPNGDSATVRFQIPAVAFTTSATAANLPRHLFSSGTTTRVKAAVPPNLSYMQAESAWSDATSVSFGHELLTGLE